MAFCAILWSVFSVFLAPRMRRLDAWSACSVPALIVLLEWLLTHALPLFGTAQATTRPWVEIPGSATLAAIAGIPGLAMVTGGTASALAWLIQGPRQRWAGALLATWVLVAMTCWAIQPRPSTERSATIAVIGFDCERETPNKNRLRSIIEGAAKNGASLIVLPEGMFAVRGNQNSMTLRTWLADMAQSLNITVIAGVMDYGQRTNHAWIIGPNGSLIGDYRKNHLIPMLEDYLPGDGSLVIFDGGGLHCGVMICQDDNFTDLARSYSRSRIDVLLVPSNDWRGIAQFHAQSSQLRGSECGFSVARAVSNGVTQISDDQGHILVRCEPDEDGISVGIASIRHGTSPTFYAHWGDWLVPLAGLLVIGERLRLCRSK